jgi:microcystin-dependent protein
MVDRVPQTNPQGFPQIGSPLVTPQTGVITNPWLYFLQTLWNRSGAGSGAAQAPVGMIVAFAASLPPTGWLICDGSAISRTTYATLFAVIGTEWGVGDGTNTFNVPDLRGRFGLGVSGSHALASTGGAETVTLSVGQLPSHTHTINDPGHVHTALVASSTNTAGAAAGTATAGNTGSTVTGITINNTGSGNPVTILNPFASVQMIIKAA